MSLPSGQSKKGRYLFIVAALVLFAVWLSSTGWRTKTVPPADGCAGIQKAIDSLPASGGEVILEAGTYLCRHPVVISRDRVRLRGTGPSTVLKLADRANCPVIVIGSIVPQPANDVSGVSVSDLAIDGNRAGQQFECWDGVCDTGEKTVIRSSGIVFRRAVDCQIARINASQCRSAGVVTEKGCRRLTVSDLTATGNQFDGLACYETEESVFTRLHLHDNPFAGISLDWRFNGNVISDAVLVRNGAQGVFMRDARRNQFHGIVIRGSGQQGVFIAQVEDKPETAATHNVFTGLTIEHSAGAAVRINDASCVSNGFQGAALFDNKGGGVSEAVPGLARTDGVVSH